MFARAIPRRRQTLRTNTENRNSAQSLGASRTPPPTRNRAVAVGANSVRPCNLAPPHNPTGGYRIRPYANQKYLALEGSIGEETKSVKKRAALLHFLGKHRQGGVSRQIHTLKPAKHPGCLQLVAKFYKQLKITYLCNILNCFSSCRVLSTRVRTRWSIAQQCRGPARARTKLRSCLCAPGESCCFPAASHVPRSASSLH